MYGNILLGKLLSVPLEPVGLQNNYWIKMNTSRMFSTPALHSGSQFHMFVWRQNLLTVLFMFFLVPAGKCHSCFLHCLTLSFHIMLIHYLVNI